MEAQSQSQAPGTVAGAAGPRRPLSAEFIAVLGVGATLGILTLAGTHGIRADMRDLRVDIRDLGVRLAGVEQRVARLEGLFEGFRDTIDKRWPPRSEEES